MPVVAVVAAIAVDAGAIGALAAGTLTTLGAITAIGATLGAIGAVTGNKTLGLVGGAIGLVGGIGSLAFGSDALGNVSDLFGSSGSAASGAAGAEAGLAGGIGADEGIGNGIGGAVGAGTDASNIDLALSATGEVGSVNPAGIINSSLSGAEGNTAAIATGGDTGSALGEALTAPQTAGLDVAQTAATSPSNIAGLTASQLSDGTALAKAGGFWNWAKNNQLLAYGVLQAGGSFISGLTNPMTPAQIEALKAQAAYNNAAAGLAQKQAENMKTGVPIATVTGKTAPQGSLINNTPIAPPAVTGAPNTGLKAPQPAVTGVPA